MPARRPPSAPLPSWATTVCRPAAAPPLTSPGVDYDIPVSAEGGIGKLGRRLTDAIFAIQARHAPCARLVTPRSTDRSRSMPGRPSLRERLRGMVAAVISNQCMPLDH